MAQNRRRGRTDGEAAVEQSAAEVEATQNEEFEQGYRGTKVDPLPNEAYSLESGPDAPSLLDARAALAEAEAERGLAVTA